MILIQILTGDLYPNRKSQKKQTHHSLFYHTRNHKIWSFRCKPKIAWPCFFPSKTRFLYADIGSTPQNIREITNGKGVKPGHKTPLLSPHPGILAKENSWKGNARSRTEQAHTQDWNWGWERVDTPCQDNPILSAYEAECGKGKTTLLWNNSSGNRCGKSLDTNAGLDGWAALLRLLFHGPKQICSPTLCHFCAKNLSPIVIHFLFWVTEALAVPVAFPYLVITFAEWGQANRLLALALHTLRRGTMGWMIH